MAAEPTETAKTTATPTPRTDKGESPPYNPELSYRAFPDWHEPGDEAGKKKERSSVAGVLHRMLASWP